MGLGIIHIQWIIHAEGVIAVGVLEICVDLKDHQGLSGGHCPKTPSADSRSHCVIRPRPLLGSPSVSAPGHVVCINCSDRLDHRLKSDKNIFTTLIIYQGPTAPYPCSAPPAQPPACPPAQRRSPDRRPITAARSRRRRYRGWNTGPGTDRCLVLCFPRSAKYNITAMGSFFFSILTWISHYGRYKDNNEMTYPYRRLWGLRWLRWYYI